MKEERGRRNKNGFVSSFLFHPSSFRDGDDVMVRWFAITGCLLSLLGTRTLPAQELLPPAVRESGEALTLQRLEELADQYNPILPRDRAQIDAARGNAAQAGTWNNPRFDTNNPQVFNGRTTLLNVGVQQEIPVMGKKRLDQAAANQVTHQTEFTYTQDRIALLTSIRQQFYQVLADQRRLQVLTEMVEVLRRSYETGEQQHRAGTISQADLLLLLLDLQRVRGQLFNARALLAGDRKQLGYIVGIPGLITGDVAGELSGDYPVFNEEMVNRFVMTQNTQVLIARAVIDQAKYQLRRAEVEPFPNPYLGPAYQYGLLPGGEQFWFNIQFDIPVLNRNRGGIRAARGNLHAAQENLTTIQNNLLNQAHNLLSQYEGAREMVRNYETNILPTARELLRLHQEGFRKGLTDFSTFLQMQRSLVQVNSDYLDTLTNLWTNAVQMSGLLQLEKFR
jgi:outer membrane protein, heavy metal efflux system